MTELPRKVEINLAAIPVSGFGGMCMVIASLVCAASLTQTRWFMIAGLATGVVFGCAMIWLRRTGESSTPTDTGQPPAVADEGIARRSRTGLITLGRLRIAHL
jgi:hypothetical protein